MSADFTPEKEDLKILTPFKMQVLTNFPYIEADFDALTNYQLLCKVVEYLNNVIAETNEVTEQTLSLYNAYVALQNYVNTYFDNLDLQELIDNKLDEMAEDGTLADIVAEYIKMQGQLVYNTVEEMKAAENIQNGSFLKTYGFYQYNDGGGALYKARTVTNEDVIDEKFIIALNNNTLIAELIIPNYFVIDIIGAKGNGTNDDSIYFEAAMEKVKEINGNLDKTYLADIEINTSDFTLNNINLKGTITFDESLRFINIINCKIDASNKNYGIYTDHPVTKLVIDNCFIHDALNTGLYLDKCWDCQINKISLSSNAVMGAYLKAFNSSVFNGTCYYNGTGMLIESSSACNIRATIQENKKTGIDIRAINGSKFQLYLEQNGYEGTTDFEKTQCYLGAENQANVGNSFEIYAIGGAGSEMESKYGLYSQWSYDSTFTGCLFNHTDSGCRFTSNNTNITCDLYDNTHVDYGTDNLLVKHAYYKQITSNTVFDINEKDDCIPVILSDTAYMVSFNRRSSTQGLIRVTDKDGVNQTVTCNCYILKSGIRSN